jgi:hypothetical protein
MVFSTYRVENGIQWNKIKIEAENIRKTGELLVNFYTDKTCSVPFSFNPLANTPLLNFHFIIFCLMSFG